MLWRDNFTEIQHDQTPLTFTDWLALTGLGVDSDDRSAVHDDDVYFYIC